MNGVGEGENRLEWVREIIEWGEGDNRVFKGDNRVG